MFRQNHYVLLRLKGYTNPGQAAPYYRNGNYNARDIFEQNPVVNRILNALIDGTIPNIKSEGREIFDSLTVYNDEYFVLRDFNDYVRAQADLEKLYRDPKAWAQASLMNIANVGRFSSDAGR